MEITINLKAQTELAALATELTSFLGTLRIRMRSRPQSSRLLRRVNLLMRTVRTSGPKRSPLRLRSPPRNRNRLKRKSHPTPPLRTARRPSLKRRSRTIRRRLRRSSRSFLIFSSKQSLTALLKRGRRGCRSSSNRWASSPIWKSPWGTSTSSS